MEQLGCAPSDSRDDEPADVTVVERPADAVHARILEEATVDQAFRNQIGQLDFPAEILTADPPITDTLRVGPGYKWGYGLLLNTDDVPGGRRAGTGAWAGLFNTHFFIDRTTSICASIYTNSLPFVTYDEAWRMYGDFEQALYAAI